MSLTDAQLDAPIDISVEGIDETPTVRSLLSRLVGQLDMWNQAVANRRTTSPSKITKASNRCEPGWPTAVRCSSGRCEMPVAAGPWTIPSWTPPGRRHIRRDDRPRPDLRCVPPHPGHRRPLYGRHHRTPRRPAGMGTGPASRPNSAVGKPGLELAASELPDDAGGARCGRWTRSATGSWRRSASRPTHAAGLDATIWLP